MKAKSRRRLLISSIAMLLVAMLALGTATFAWFSQNAKATASDIGAKTQRGSNILVSENGSTWKDAIVFGNKATGFYTPVTPGSNMASPSWKTTTADAMDAGVMGASPKTLSDTGLVANTDYTSTKLYVKYDAASTDTVDVDIKFTVTLANGSSSEDFLRVALVPVDSTTKGVFGNDAVVWGTAADDFAKAPAAMSLTTAATTAQTITNTTSKTLYTEKTLTGAAEYQFNLYVWFEGTDPDCIDSNANTNFDIDFEVAKH